MGSGNWPLVHEACRTLSLNNRLLGEYLGWSRRTIQRHIRSGHFTYAPDLHKLAKGVHPHNPELAGRLAAAGGITLEGLGLRPAAARGQLAGSSVRPEHADSVVCAAADALKLHPAAVRPAIDAALGRMQELGLSIEALRPLLAVRPRAKRADD